MKTKVPKLNKAGIRQLADDLVAHKKMYNQQTYGTKVSKSDDEEDCGTFACMAGICLWRQIGARKFNKLAAGWLHPSSGGPDCMPAGLKQLGIAVESYLGAAPQLFEPVCEWPKDIRDEYESNGPTWRVIAALKALQRLRVDGTIDPNPKAVHTRLPQLTKLLKSAAAKKALVTG